MPVATTYSSAEIGIDAPPVTVEVEVRPGLPQVLIVGLPQAAVRESKDRVRAAIISSGFAFPDKRITVGETRHHAPWEEHAMRTLGSPFFCYALWRGDGLADLPKMTNPDADSEPCGPAT